MIKSANGEALAAIGDFIKEHPYLLAGGGVGALLGGLGGYNMVDETGDEEEDSSTRTTGGVVGGLAGLLAGVATGYLADRGLGSATGGAKGNDVQPKQDATEGKGNDAANVNEGPSLLQRLLGYAYNTTTNETVGEGAAGAVIGAGAGAGAGVLKNRSLGKQLAGARTDALNAANAVRDMKNATGVADEAILRKMTFDGANGAALIDARDATAENVSRLSAKTSPHANNMRVGIGSAVGAGAGILAAPYVHDAGRRIGNAFMNYIAPTQN